MATTKSQDAIALLKEDHRKVEELFEQFEKAKGEGRKQKLALEICKELTIHTILEEEIFYPAIKGKVVGLALAVSYAVPSAGWQPIWEARLEPGEAKVELALHGSVWQRTGEDWKDARLAVSTAAPARGLFVPDTLCPQHLDKERFRGRRVGTEQMDVVERYLHGVRPSVERIIVHRPAACRTDLLHAPHRPDLGHSQPAPPRGTRLPARRGSRDTRR
jgi:hypothetical protein